MGLISSRFEMMNESRCSWPCLQQSSFSTLAMNAFVRRFRERATPDGGRETGDGSLVSAVRMGQIHCCQLVSNRARKFQFPFSILRLDKDNASHFFI